MLPTPYVKCDFNKVYEPAEDSFLLLDSLETDLSFLAERFDKKLALVSEIGPGSGIITTFMVQNGIPNKNGSIYTALDVNPWALDATEETLELNKCTKLSVDLIQSDLTTSIKPGQIDLLVFNPPYVPAEDLPEIPNKLEDTDQWLDLALLGGEDGMIITQKVLDQLDNTLSPNGVAYILFCARNKPEEIVRKLSNKWDVKLVEHRKAGWEVLSVYRFMRF